MEAGCADAARSSFSTCTRTPRSAYGQVPCANTAQAYPSLKKKFGNTLNADETVVKELFAQGLSRSVKAAKVVLRGPHSA